MPITVLLMLLALPVLLVASGFFSGSETALFSLSRHQRTTLARSTGVTAGTIMQLLSETRALLITLLLGNMIINVLYINTCALLMLRLSRLPAVGSTLATIANLVPLVGLIMLGEVLPKLIAARTPMTWAKVIALPMLLVHRALSPVRVFFSIAVITPLARLIAPKTHAPALSADELESLLTLSQRRGVIDADEERLLQQVLQLSRMKVRDLMTPRVDIVAFELGDEPQALLELIRQTRLRHIPVYRHDLDDIVGLLYSRQVLTQRPSDSSTLEPMIRQVKFVPELQRADQLLVDLRKTGTTLAIAVDEYGGTAGLVTIEDVVEHIVGNIPGEYEPGREPQLEQLAPGRWRASADLSVQEWLNLFAGRGDAPADTVRTIGGLVMARLGRAPEAGDRIVIGNVTITVEQIDGPRLMTVLIELSDGEAPAAAPGPATHKGGP
jgi:CBS domain containing-hemolysin-like protein